MAGSFQASRSQTRFSSPVLGYGTSPWFVAHHDLASSHTSIQVEDIDPEPVPQYRWNSMDNSTWVSVSRHRGRPQSQQRRPYRPCTWDVYLASISRTPHCLPISPTGIMVSLLLLATEEMASRLPNPRPSWPTSKVTLSKVPVQAKRGSFVDLVSACSQQIICLLTTSNTTANTDASSSSSKIT